MKSTAVLAIVGASAIALIGCGSSATTATAPATTAASASSGSTSMPPATKATGTTKAADAKKSTGTTMDETTGTMPGVALGTHTTEYEDGTKVAGAATCSYGNKHIRLILAGFEDSSRVTVDFDPDPNAKVDTGTYVLRSKTNGNPLAKGPASITGTVHNNSDGTQDFVFSWSARYTPIDGGEGGTVTGQGACTFEGDHFG
jgi:hypothetical protein